MQIEQCWAIPKLFYNQSIQSKEIRNKMYIQLKKWQSEISPD